MLEAGEEFKPTRRLEPFDKRPRGRTDPAEDGFQVFQDDFHIAIGKCGGDKAGYFLVFRPLVAVAEGEGVVRQMNA